MASLESQLTPEQIALRNLTQALEAMQIEMRQLAQHNLDLNARNHDLEDRLTRTPPIQTPSVLEGHMTALVEELRAHRLVPAPAATNPTTTVPIVVSKSERHPDPAAFDGNPKDLDRFTSQLYNKLRMNADRYPLEDQRVGYAFGRLEGNAAIAMEGFWTQGSCSILTVTDFVAHLERLYGNPNKVEHAANEWLNLRQGNKEFTHFLAEFERLAALATINDDLQKRRQLGLAIGDKLRFRMVTLDTVPADYVGFRDKCTQIESRLAEANTLSTISKASQAHGVSSSRLATTSYRTTSTVSPAAPYVIAQTTRSNSTAYAPRLPTATPATVQM